MAAEKAWREQSKRDKAEARLQKDIDSGAYSLAVLVATAVALLAMARYRAAVATGAPTNILVTTYSS